MSAMPEVRAALAVGFMDMEPELNNDAALRLADHALGITLGDCGADHPVYPRIHCDREACHLGSHHAIVNDVPLEWGQELSEFLDSLAAHTAQLDAIEAQQEAE